MSTRQDRVRLYHQVRSAHLERAAQLPPATIVYSDKRYDFEDALADQLDLVQARGWRVARYMFRHPAAVLEVNEPLMLDGARSTACALVGLGLRRLLGGPRAQVVSYAIENFDPRSLPRPARLKHRLARRLDLGLARLVWRRLDRIAYGTQAAQELYTELGGVWGGKPESTVIWALPAPAPDAEAHGKVPGQVLYLGAFVTRKGLPQLLEAWPRVRDERPDARLVLVGKGALQPMADGAAADDDSISTVIDPPRERIRELLRTSQVLVLPSQPTPRWREQVGLPIVEALSYGCTVVTTRETGLASWLAGHGHGVVSASADAAELSAAVAAALSSPVDPAEVLAALPAEDGRLAADAWLFA